MRLSRLDLARSYFPSWRKESRRNSEKHGVPPREVRMTYFWLDWESRSKATREEEK